jgi:hypothetical protein
MRTGEIYAGQLEAVVTMATPETKADAIAFAQQSSNADLERAAIRMADALLTFTKYNPANALGDSMGSTTVTYF